MNRTERATLGVLLDQLWATRNGAGNASCPVLCPHQRELIAAAMRIVAGSTDGPNLPPPTDQQQHLTKFVGFPGWQANLRRHISNWRGRP